MKNRIISLLLLLGLSSAAFAYTPPDEGMWLPMFLERLNYTDMQKMGLKLTPKELYDINNSSLKDAIVNFGNFCTAEVVSENGLLFTNHHCGYDAIQKHSSVTNDYLTDGFWASTYSEELPNEGLTATFLVKMDDVTGRVLQSVKPDMTEAQRSDAIRGIMKTLSDEANEDGKYMVNVRGFYNGNEFYRFVYKVYRDVRLVGAPPSGIGKFGGDTDNWMWPRHTGDFSVFRIYGDANGEPAAYSKDNVPLNTPKFLKISTKGVKKGDFAMTWGYPGSTDRYMTSYGINSTINESNPAIVKLLGASLDVMKKYMDADQATHIQYASHYFGLSNFWKNKIGETRGLKRLDVYDKKKKLEDEFEAWVNADPARKAKYGEVIPLYQSAADSYNQTQFNKQLWYYQIPFFASQFMSWTLQARALPELFEKTEKKDLEAIAIALKQEADKHFKDYNPAIEEDLTATLLEIFRQDMPPSALPDIYKKIDAKYKGNIRDYVRDVFRKSAFATGAAYAKFLEKPTAKAVEKDPGIELGNSFFNKFMEVNGQSQEVSAKLSKADRLFVAGLREMQPDKVFYPDANSTMRVSYGQVLDYFPADAVHYDLVTYAEGILEKEDPSNEEFVVPAKLKQLIEAKDFGRWAAENGRLPINFLSTNDITGGNSGSPVIDGEGHLIGIAFDGNWEAMSGDIAFEPELQRTISVDIRYVMFVIDKFANAQNLMRELKLAE